MFPTAKANRIISGTSTPAALKLKHHYLYAYLQQFFIRLGYTYLSLKKKISTRNSKQFKVSIVPNCHPVGKITILFCDKTAHYAVSTTTHVSNVLFEILHIDSASLHVVHIHLSSLVQLPK